MGNHSATIELRGDLQNQYAVIIEADEVIWIDDKLLTTAIESTDPGMGGMTVNGDLIRFGTPGEGLGRLTYRLTGREPNPYGGPAWHVAERIEEA